MSNVVLVIGLIIDTALKLTAKSNKIRLLANTKSSAIKRFKISVQNYKVQYW